MKVSILAPNVSSNSFGRAFLLAKVLSRRYDTEIVGPAIGKGIWPPLSDEKSVPVKTLRMNGIFRPYFLMKRLARMIEGDVIYCSKPLLTSLGIGLYLKKYFAKPLVLDIDDWELGFGKELVIQKNALNFKYLLSSTIYPYKAYSIWNFLFMERFIHHADEVTVSNSFLQEKFGGRILWHGRDTSALDPARFRGEEIRKKHKINNRTKVVMFLGTPRPHKGLVQLINSVKLLGDLRINLVIVGVDDSPYCIELAEYGKVTLGDQFVTIGQQPFEKVPEFLAMADVIAIPQEKAHSTLGQIPAKIFDAMSMAKPTVATAVSDIPHILEGCGWVVEPGNGEMLAEAIRYILDHPKEAEEKGCLARQRCIQYFSWDRMETNLLDLFEKFNGLN